MPACSSSPAARRRSPAPLQTSKTSSTRNGSRVGEVPLLRRNHLRYVVVDRRAIASDNLRGYYFSRDDAGEELLPKTVATKFNAVPGISRIYSNGFITVFDLGAGR